MKQVWSFNLFAMKNFSDMSNGAKSALTGVALVAGLAGSASEAQAATVSVRVNDLVVGSWTNFTEWGRASILFLDENKDIVSDVGDLYIYTKPVTGDNIDGWIENTVFKEDGTLAGSFDTDIDWLSYKGSEYDGTLLTSVGTTYGASNFAIWLNPENLIYTYDNGISPVPVPASAFLFATGLPLLLAASRKRQPSRVGFQPHA